MRGCDLVGGSGAMLVVGLVRDGGGFGGGSSGGGGSDAILVMDLEWCGVVWWRFSWWFYY